MKASPDSLFDNALYCTIVGTSLVILSLFLPWNYFIVRDIYTGRISLILGFITQDAYLGIAYCVMAFLSVVTSIFFGIARIKSSLNSRALLKIFMAQLAYFNIVSGLTALLCTIPWVVMPCVLTIVTASLYTVPSVILPSVLTIVGTGILVGYIYNLISLILFLAALYLSIRYYSLLDDMKVKM